MTDSDSLRASDADRDQVADKLREALAEGRITPEEHAERIDAVYQAKTYAELAPVLSDLPGQSGPAPSVSLRKEENAPAPVSESANIVAVFSGAERRGRWLVEPKTTLTMVFGGVELDLRQAVLSQREVEISVTCVFGGLDITVPPGVRVTWNGFTMFGGQQLPGDDPDDLNAPHVKLTGVILFGGIDVKRREQGDLTKAQRRAERREHHRGLHDHHLEIREQHQAFHAEMRRARADRREHLRELRDARRASRRRC
ncbi:DUF1707 SHOCT-like domain-containing protein [Actinomadura barringtoniae]|uniref:DUF1707 SHOCT-like domain-containing protein n=1 Tax=Actinomadura barringtoniae TaxID=1427535 RepID=UPI0027DCEAAB|nr:DUF1707 domain-containing protein [Actinomadura barringtoniae]